MYDYKLLFYIGIGAIIIIDCTESISDPKVANGSDGDILNFPYQLSLRNPDGNNHFKHFCGAVLISDTHAVTAAHCMFLYPTGLRRETKNVVVAAGQTSINGDIKFPRKVSEIHVHDDYNTATLYSDIAILKLESPLGISIPGITPLNITHSHNKSSGECLVSGWGALQEGGNLSETLQYGTIHIIQHEKCRYDYRNTKNVIDETVICGSSYPTDALKGDSGGPLYCKAGGFQGIVSTGLNHSTGLYPGIYTSVPHFYPWIKNKSISVNLKTTDSRVKDNMDPESGSHFCHWTTNSKVKYNMDPEIVFKILTFVCINYAACRKNINSFALNNSLGILCLYNNYSIEICIFFSILYVSKVILIL